LAIFIKNKVKLKIVAGNGKSTSFVYAGKNWNRKDGEI
jgi:hypothetical protein